MKLASRVVSLLVLAVLLVPFARAQLSEPIASLLIRFDNQHDLAAKERLLIAITSQGLGAGPALLRLAKSTANSDTRWMAMRGMATLHFTACAPFLEASLKDSDALVRSNAARALGIFESQMRPHLCRPCLPSSRL